MFLLNSTFKKTKLTHQSKDTIKVIYCYILFFVNTHFILGPDSKFFPYYCFLFLCIIFNESYLTCMTRWLAYYTHSSISKSCFFNTLLDMKTKNQNLIDIMKTVAADIDFQ